MSLEYFEGPAGSGKSHQLIETLKKLLESQPLGEREAILGLTYMHGSRRRMHNQLAKIAKLRGRFLACTIDSLARRVICRWRSAARDIEPNLDVNASTDFHNICRIAALLLTRASVSGWLRARYPIVLVDEFQDCKGDRLGIVQALESACHVIAAADDFQDLQQTGPSPAVEWLHGGAGKKHALTGKHRTNDAILLQAAQRLRSSQDCGNVLGSTLVKALNSNVAAGHMARTICWKKPKDAAILTPTGPTRSPFVRDAVARLISKPITPKGIDVAVGPFRIRWESDVEDEKTVLLTQLGELAYGLSAERLHVICASEKGPLGDLLQWADRKSRVKGQAHFSQDDLTAALERILQSRRAFLPIAYPGSIRAMTLYQAKNREFEGVLILWPFAIGGDLESERRRLYNALTRAKKWAIVIVQDAPNTASRLSQPPFSKPV